MKKEKNKLPPAFWDTSGIIPLCCNQPQSANARKVFLKHSDTIVWWGTSIEAISGFCRLRRSGIFTRENSRDSENAVEYLRAKWHEIQPTLALKQEAERILHIHQLRAADALQLAAALIWCDKKPKGFHFVCADIALLKAADAEGFSVIDIN